MTKYKGIFLCVVITFMLEFWSSSCKKFIQIPPSPDQIVSAVVFADDKTATSAMDGLYSQIMGANYFLLNGGVSIEAALSADEIYNRISGLADDNEFYTNSLSASNNNLNTRLWSGAYRQIYQVNAILEGLNSSMALTPMIKDRLIGDAKFMRALYYFYLVNLFGRVPLITSTNYNVTATLSRSELSEVYQQIITDLLDAQKLLDDVYPSNNRICPDKFAVTALLARVYLYNKDWSEAAAQATSVISSGYYKLETDLNKVFLINSNETIFQLQVVNSFNCTTEGLAFIPGAAASSAPVYPLTSYLVAAFSDDDLRAKDWIKSKEVNGNLFYYPYKYKTDRLQTPPEEYNIVLRLAEQFLIRAEANARIGRNKEALSDLNIVRNRAGLSNVSLQGSDPLLDEIFHERQIELFTEWGHRWLDLRRFGKADDILGIEKTPFWESTDSLYPIPLKELRLNPFLDQNPGY